MLQHRFGSTNLVGPDQECRERRAPHHGRSTFPAAGVGLQFILKPVQKMLASLEYAQGVEGNQGVYLKFGYAW